MSGHSKWSNIKHKKAETDKKRAALFNKIAKAITVEARERGGDPEKNPTLNNLIEKAKEANMPKEKIEKAIKRGTGELKEKTNLEESIMEAYTSEGAAILIKVITDNKNRTASELRNILSNHGGKLTEEGSAKFLFEKVEREKGVIEWQPKAVIPVGEDAKNKLKSLFEELDQQDDVQEIYSNVDL